MVFGRVGQERLQLNESTLWAGGPYTPDNPEAAAALPQVRRLLAERRYEEATALASSKVMARPLWQMSYGSLGDLLLTFPGARGPDSFERQLDLETAVATTTYASDGASYRREAFASAPHQAIVMRMVATGGSPGATIDFDLTWRAPRKTQYVSPGYHGAATNLMWWKIRLDAAWSPPRRSRLRTSTPSALRCARARPWTARSCATCSKPRPSPRPF